MARVKPPSGDIPSFPYRYRALSSPDDIEASNDDEPLHSKYHKLWHIGLIVLSITAFMTAIFAVAMIRWSFEDAVLSTDKTSKESYCTSPGHRREWRQLTVKERLQYISAVKCLEATPSKIHVGDTLYDDFPWLHQRVGMFAHDAATFLSWHRYFIHLYESTLREACSYRGYMPYWDWALDYENPAAAPIFDSVSGFGGNGDPHAPESVGAGHCVTSGPFAGWQAKYFDAPNDTYHEHTVQPHCLSRSFRDGDTFSGHKFRPAAMKTLFDQEAFDAFFEYLEFGPHNGPPQGIRGDFLTFTAPYEPIFFLHHTQIDRLWWIWQHDDPIHRMMEYSGRTNGTVEGKNTTASIIDVLPFHGLGRDVTVEEIMSTESEILCYRY